jgi:glycosyltransferase involved in cell wall biosynthesis
MKAQLAPEVPWVSVITPAFNAAATLPRAFRSLQAQTFGKWEYIVVDDGSTDDTAKAVGRFDDPRLRSVIRTVNRGSGAALNAGIVRAKGRYLAFLDADDEFLPTHLASHILRMENEPGVDLLWGGIELVVGDEEQAWVPDVSRGHGYVHATECIVQGTLFIRRDVFDSVRFSEDRSVWYYDFDLVRRAEAASFECRRFELPTYRYYRDSGNSLVDVAKAKMAAQNVLPSPPENR